MEEWIEQLQNSVNTFDKLKEYVPLKKKRV